MSGRMPRIGRDAARALPVAACLCIAMATAGAADTLLLKDGRELDVIAEGVQDERLRYSQQKQFGRTATSIPLASVRSVRFANQDTLRKLVAPDSDATLEQLRQAWESTAGFLAVPGSLAGRVGAALARRLMEDGDQTALEDAREIVQRVLDEDWNDDSRQLARELQFQIMIDLGSADEVIAAAEEELAGGRLGQRISASYVLASALIRKYTQLVAEHPRWQRDPDLQPRIESMRHRIFDLLLMPMLALDGDADKSARSLWTMAGFYRQLGRDKLAASVARDIVEIYPDSQSRIQASDYLATLVEQPENPDQ